MLDGGTVAYNEDALHTVPAAALPQHDSFSNDGLPTLARQDLPSFRASSLQEPNGTVAGRPSSAVTILSAKASASSAYAPQSILQANSHLSPAPNNDSRVSSATAASTHHTASLALPLTSQHSAAPHVPHVDAKIATSGPRMIMHRPAVQQDATTRSSPVPDNSEEEGEFDFDDALQALQELEALEAPAKLSRHSTAQHASRPQHALRNARPAPSHSTAAHASSSTGQRFFSQSDALARTSQDFNRGMPSGTRPNGTERRLWVPPRVEATPAAAASPITAAPIRIMRRPGAASNEAPYIRSASNEAPYMRASNEPPYMRAVSNQAPYTVANTFEAAIERTVPVLSQNSLAQLGMSASGVPLVRMSPPEVCPTEVRPRLHTQTDPQQASKGNRQDLSRNSPDGDSALQLAAAHLMSKTFGLSPQAAVLALKVRTLIWHLSSTGASAYFLPLMRCTLCCCAVPCCASLAPSATVLVTVFLFVGCEHAIV